MLQTTATGKTLTSGLLTPLSLLDNCIGQRVALKLKDRHLMTCILHAYDEHLNVMVSKCEEEWTEISKEGEEKTTINYSKPISSKETKEGVEETYQRSIPLLFLRGDNIVTISPIKKL